MSSLASDGGNPLPGQLPPLVRTPRMGVATHEWQAKQRAVAAPMGPKPSADAAPFGMILRSALGSNLWDVEGNRYVDLAAGFGALLLGHCAPAVLRAVERQAPALLHAMGDLYPSDVKIELMAKLAELVPLEEPQVILGQSGADAISSAIKTAMLATGRSELIAFHGAYHGLSFAPLSACGLRPSYRAPFEAALGATVHFEVYPDREAATEVLERLAGLLATRRIAALLIEPVLGRGGVRPCEPETLAALHDLCRAHGTLLVLDEIWTGLGRSGAWLASSPMAQDASAPSELPGDVVCLGKGLGGGLPISACIASKRLMAQWSRSEEVVDTSTFAGAPLACAAALATLEELAAASLVARSAELGAKLTAALDAEFGGSGVQVRGRGLMVAIDLGARAGLASAVMARLLDDGFVVSTGGGRREVVILTPPLTIDETLLLDAVPVIARAVRSAGD